MTKLIKHNKRKENKNKGGQTLGRMLGEGCIYSLLGGL